MMIINHPLCASSIDYDPWHPPCSIYVPDSLLCTTSHKVWSTFWSVDFVLHTLLHAITIG